MYTLEIYAPNSLDEVVHVFKSDTPFLAISKWDILDKAFLDNTEWNSEILLVHWVHHILWENEGKVKHKICVYTKSISNEREEIKALFDGHLKLN